MTKSTSPHAARNFLFANILFSSDECLIWPYSRNNRGYGELNMDGFGTRLAHRIMCFLTKGNPPDLSYHASHSCGNGTNGCINPQHLSWKTAVANAQDKKLHGTQLFGERHQNTKLTELEALCIKYSNESRKQIAARYGISARSVCDIKNGYRWKHLP